MEVIPAIDLVDGQCVRLMQGDYSKKTVYSDDPVEVALRWESLGATRIHIVDLDGARLGEPANLGVIGRIASSVGVPIQMGGGVRSIDAAREVIGAGVQRVMLGTVAVRDPDIVAEARSEFGEDAVVVAVDSRDGYVSVSGWTSSSRIRAADLLQRMSDGGVKTFLCTDIAKDGTLDGPDYQLMRELVEVAGRGVIAAGGVASVEHVRGLARTGVGGVVIGKALYTGDIDLAEALETAGGVDSRC